MNCPQCNASLADQAKFCHQCGRAIADDERFGGNVLGEPRAVIPPENGGDAAAASPAARFQPLAGTAGGRAEDEIEEAIWEGSYSPKAMISAWIAVGLLTIVLLVGTLALNRWGGTGWLVTVGLIIAGWAFLLLRLVYMRLSVHYRLSTQRFVHEKGILRRVTDRIEVIDIDDVAYEQGLVDRFVGVGTIRLSTSDRSHNQLDLHGIENVKEVADLIDAARRKERVKRGLHIEAV